MIIIESVKWAIIDYILIIYSGYLLILQVKNRAILIMTKTQILLNLSLAEITNLCERYFVRKLPLFASILRDDFTSISDVDILVEKKLSRKH
jgi:hypothetical protein